MGFGSSWQTSVYNILDFPNFQVTAGLSGGGVSPGLLSPQQALFMQQQGMTGSRMPFGQQTPGGVLQGPLAYLEKTTSNIGKLLTE